jgi:hypothetical protein
VSKGADAFSINNCPLSINSWFHRECCWTEAFFITLDGPQAMTTPVGMTKVECSGGEDLRFCLLRRVVG